MYDDKETRHKRLHSILSYFMKLSKSQNFSDREKIAGCQELGGGERTGVAGTEKVFGVMEIFCIIIVVLAT